MAWLMRKSISVEDSPLVRWTPETTAAIVRANAEVVARYSHLPPDDPEFVEVGNAPAGHPFPEPVAPREAVIEELHGPLPDAVSETIVNDRIRSAIERIEPGVHQFIPTTLILPGGMRDNSWWNLRVCHRIDSLAYDNCEDVHDYLPHPVQYPELVRYRSNEDRRMKLAIRKERIQGMALWFDFKFSRTFFSEQLGQYFLDHGIRGYRLRPQDDLNRSNHVEEV